MKRKQWFIALVVAVVGMISTASLVSAAKPVEFSASGPIAVTSISDPIPAGRSGRVRIEMETIASIDGIASDSPHLDGKRLSLHQKSNELFSSADLTTAVVINGSSVGSFDVVDPATGRVVASGKYHLKVSNVPGCQIYDQGNWGTTRNSGLKGRGSVVACLNYVPEMGAFAGQVTLTGTLN